MNEYAEACIEAAARLRGQHRHAEALAIMEGLDPSDGKVALVRAQLAFESWQPSIDLLRHALSLRPDHGGLIRNLATALAAEGETDAADRLLESRLKQSPNWIDGHRSLANLRATSGDPRAEQSFADAVAKAAHLAALWLEWFQWLSKARQWERADAVLDQAVATLGQRNVFKIARLYLDAESGKSRDPHLFAEVAAFGDPGVDLARVRHALRLGNAAAVEGIVDRHRCSPIAAMFLPYQSLAWRVLRDERAGALDRMEVGVRQIDLGYSTDDLDAVAAFIRSLHTTSAPQIDQSVRGGTQTERSLLLHHDPLIGELRERIMRAVAGYTEQLPPAVRNHPWLGTRRTGWRLEGSWSVRLVSGGHHVPHTHPNGWLSSALHVVLPAADPGKLRFGLPPSELGLTLDPVMEVEPLPGHLVLFPSMLWHSTASVGDGERLTVAFDIATSA